MSIINSVIAVIPVKDFDRALNWYINLFDRNPDMQPMEGIAEWQLVDNAWVQLTVAEECSANATVIVGVDDVEGKRQELLQKDLPAGELIEYPGVIKMFEVSDLEGNKISFVQDISTQ